MKRLSKEVKQCLNKALDSALLAVETYNKPAIKFKSSGYIVLMSIAWTALFHAIFYRRKIKPIYKDGRFYKRVNEDLQFWELTTCVRKYFEDVNNPIRKNIEFFIPLRNKIEHKFLPELDANIFAECQSFLLNFDKIVEQEFGVCYCLRESLSFALQLFPSSETLEKVVRKNKDLDEVLAFIEKYRSSITTDVLKSGEYAFKAFLIQVANHKSKDVLPIQFYPYDKMTDEEKRNVDRITALVKLKTVPVGNMNKLKPKDVVERVQKGLGNMKILRGAKEVDKFNMDTHTRCWKKYKVRPLKGNPHPEQTNSRYCTYDTLYGQYAYTEDWVSFLISKLKDKEEYNSLYNS